MRRQSDKLGISFDKPGHSAIFPALEMNTTFTKQIKMHVLPAIVCMAKWQRCSRLAGVVGTKS